MSKIGILGTINTSSQEVAVDGLINLGTTYRKFISKNKCGFPTFSLNGNSITINHKGMYHVTVVATVSAPVAGDVTLQLALNGNLLAGALATETITTADTELRTLTIDYFVLVDDDIVLNYNTVASDTLTVINTGVESTIENIIVNVEKEV